MMLNSEDSRMLARVKQLAIAKNDIKMIKALSKVKSKKDITKDMENYK